MKMRIVLADDHAGMLQQLVSMLRDDCDVVAAVQDGTAALHAIHRLNPDLAILDVMIPLMNGFEVLRLIRESGSEIPVLFVTGCHDADLEMEALKAGAQGFLCKSQLSENLVHAVRAISVSQEILLRAKSG